MRRIIILLAVLFVIFCGVIEAKELSPQEIQKIKVKISKLQKEITRLQKKLKQTKAKAKKEELSRLINYYSKDIKALKKSLETASKPKMIVPSTPEVVTQEVEEKVPEVKRIIEVSEKKPLFEFGGTWGYWGGGSALLAEARVPLSFIFGPATTSFRISSGWAQSSDEQRRFLPLNVDLIFNFPPGWFTGVNNYLGAGINYVLLTTGRTSGTIGGEIFYGVESEGFGGVVFGEMGYGILRTGFSPSQKGITVMIGYRTLWRL